jgi:hypothetical protein
MRVLVGGTLGGEVGQEVAEGTPAVVVGVGGVTGVEVAAKVVITPGVKLGSGLEAVALGSGVELGWGNTPTKGVGVTPGW